MHSVLSITTAATESFHFCRVTRLEDRLLEDCVLDSKQIHDLAAENLGLFAGGYGTLAKMDRQVSKMARFAAAKRWVVAVSAKTWVRAFYRFFDEEYTMKAFTTEVWILAINTKPLWKGGKIHWEIHEKHRVWWDYKEPSVRPLYLAFRFDATLKYVARVNRIEHGRTIIDVAPEMRLVKNPVHKTPATIWHFDKPIELLKPLKTGGGMYNRRTRCDFDLLLTCTTVKEIEAAMATCRGSSSPDE